MNGWRTHMLGVFLAGATLAGLAWGETLEMVTYYPAPSAAGGNFDRLHANRATIGDAYNRTDVPDADVPDGHLFVFDRIGVGTTTPAGPLHVVGVDDTTSNIIFLQGADTPAAGAPDIRLGIGTPTPLSTAPPVPNGLPGNLDVNDIFLRSANEWVSRLGLGGRYIQSVYAENDQLLTTSNAIPIQAVPQITQGVEFLRAAITPTSASSRLRIRVQAMLDYQGGDVSANVALFRVGNSSAISAIHVSFSQSTGFVEQAVLEYETPAGSTNPTTFTVRVGPSASGSGRGSQTVAVNGRTDIGVVLGGTVRSTLVIEELTG